MSIDKFELKENNKNILFKIKNYVYERIENIKNNEYIYTLILGESYLINNTSYRINGVSHLFALSGLHVSLMSLILLKIINIFRNKKSEYEETMYPYIIIFIILLLYSYIAGFRPSLLKSVIFFLLIGINKVYYFNIKPQNLLIVTYAILLIINPFFIYDIGFQLSLTITFFLLFASELYKTNNYIKKLIYASVISLFSSFPIIINNFYTLNLLSILNNLFFVPYVSFIVYPLTIVTFIFPFLNKILSFFTSILENLSHYLSNINIISINFSKIHFIFIIIYYVLLILIIKCKNRFKFIILIIILTIYLYINPLFDNKVYLYFIDVGQGDSVLIKSSNKTLLIDTGGLVEYYQEKWKVKTNTFNLMTSSMIPFYKSVGVNKIDYLFLTHGDNDHIGYARDLVNNFNVKNVIINNGKVNYKENELNYQYSNSYYFIGGIKIYSLNDFLYDDENSNSLILLVIINNKKILLMGDANKEQESYIINKYNLNDIYILKVGHHGSNTSTSEAFVNRTKPKYSIISVGKNNKFGHPTTEVINILNKNNVQIYRTDKNGTILFTFENNEENVTIFEP